MAWFMIDSDPQGVEEAHNLLQAATGTATIEVLRHPSFSWSYKKRKMLPRDRKLKLHKDLLYLEEFDSWEECTADGRYIAPISIVRKSSEK